VIFHIHTIDQSSFAASTVGRRKIAHATACALGSVSRFDESLDFILG
jgi:hypothetical protein